MKFQMIITENDYQRLMRLVARGSFKSKMPVPAHTLVERLDSAKLFPQTKIPKNVITMNSRAKLKELASEREVDITITYPQDADPRARRISVLSEIGLALLGRKENDIVSWRVPDGVGRFQVDKVIYQPEAAGDYSL